MAKTDIGPKIGIEGEAQFRRQLNEINQGMKTLDAEAKAVAASMQDEADAAKKSAAQKDVLERQISTQVEKLKKLQEGLEASAKKYGEADTRTQKWQKAVYDATADLANMEHELKGLDGAVDETTDSMEEAGDAALTWSDVMKGSICADAVKAGVKALAGFIRDAASAMRDAASAGAVYADTYNTMAATTGLSTDTLQEYAYMADLVDVSVETLTGAQTKMLNSMRKAKDGTGDAAETWEALSVNIKNADGSLRNTESVMNETLEALGKIENETERDAAAMTIFGKSAQELNPLIKTGAQELDKLRKEAHDTGYVLDGQALTALQKQQDAMDRLSKKAEAVGNSFAARLAPGVTNAANALNDAFDNPRVKMGLDTLADGIGKAADGAGNLAAKVLPELFRVFGVLDERLYLYNDTQIELASKLNDLQTEHAKLADEYLKNAEVIVDESKRNEKLWEELQTLTDETGNVKDADKERVDYILNELNEALGTEYERNGDIIEQYQEMRREIRGLIKQREAEALMAAGQDQYTQAEQKRREALQNAADYYAQIAEQVKAVEEAERDLEAARAAARNQPGYAYKGEAYVEEMTVLAKKRLLDAKKTLEDIQQDYEEARQNAAEYYETVDRYERAQSAAIQGNYEEVIRLMADEYGVNLEYYRQKRQLNEKEKQDLKEKIAAGERAIAEYKRNLEAGLTGFSEAGLKELEDYVQEARDIMDGKSIGVNFVKGIEKGLKDKDALAGVEKAAYNVAYVVEKTTKNTMQIKSPSRVGTWIGAMWDKGIAKGMESGEGELKDVAEQLSRTIAAGSVPSAAMLRTGSYGDAITAPIGTYGGAGGTSSYTTNMGGITIPIYGTGSATAQEIAKEVEIRLTDVLNRAARGGRR